MGDEQFMQMAVDVCRRGIEAGQSPFGAVIVRAGEVLACSYNGVWRDLDPTAHAEVCAIREACRRTGSAWLEGSTIYSTTEPCPMCFGAIHWARIERIVFGASIADAARAGFRELPLSNRMLKQMGNAPVVVEEGYGAEDCRALFELWKRANPNSAY